MESLRHFVAALHAEQGHGWRLADVLDELIECWHEGLSGEEAAAEIAGAFPPELGYPITEALKELEDGAQELLGVVDARPWIEAVRKALMEQREAVAREVEALGCKCRRLLSATVKVGRHPAPACLIAVAAMIRAGKD